MNIFQGSNPNAFMDETRNKYMKEGGRQEYRGE